MKLLLGLVAVLSALSAGVASADNTDADHARPLMLGEVERTSFSDEPLVLERWYVVPLVAGRSYAVYAWAPGVDPELQDPDIAEIAFFTDAGVTPVAGVSTNDQEVRVDLAGYGQAQARIVPSTPGTHWFRISTSTTPAVEFEVDLVMVETTLFTPFWVVDGPGAYVSVIELRNTTDDVVTVVLRAFGATGAEVGVQPPVTIPVPADGGSLVDVKATMGAPAGFGSAQLAHTGPPGAIVANMTIISTAAGVSFDSPFEPRMRWTPLGRYP